MRIYNIALIVSLTALVCQPTFALDSVRLQLKWLHQFQFAGYYAAIEQGYYREAGLKVELIEADSQSSPMQTVIDGAAEYGVSTSDIVRLRADGNPVVALAVIFQHSPLALISSKRSGVETIHDLAGKKIMIQDGSADLIALLKAKHVPIDRIEFVPHDFSYESLLNGTVSAFSGYVTNEVYSLDLANAEPLIFAPQTVGIDFYGDALFTTEAQIQKHPEQVEAFRTASLRGWDYALQHPDEMVDLIFEKYTQRKSKAELLFEAQKTSALIRRDLVQIGHMNPHRWEHIARILKNEGMLQNPVDIDAMLYHPHTPTPLGPILKVTGIAALCLSLLGAFTLYQIKLKRQLESEIKRRVKGDQMLLKREEEYRHLYEHAPLAFIVWDTDLRIREWNHAAEALFGWTAKEVIGTKADDFLVPDSAIEKVNQGKANLQKQQHVAQINDNCTKDGRIICCKWHNIARRGPSGETTEFHSIAIDVSDETREHSRLEDAYKHAMSSTAAKDILLAHTSHEIRNPLNAIMGFTQILISDSQDPGTKDMAKIILDGAQSMLEILNDLLDSAKLEAGKMEVEWEIVDLVTCIKKEAKLFSQLITNRGLAHSLHIDQDIPKITSDTRCIKQILNNLINNATKFTTCGKIDLSLEKDGEHHIIIHVSDTGVGMDEATLTHVFEPYAQANSRNVGTGLGLSLTKKLAERINGTILAESIPGEGSRFSLRLPIQHPEDIVDSTA